MARFLSIRPGIAIALVAVSACLGVAQSPNPAVKDQPFVSPFTRSAEQSKAAQEHYAAGRYKEALEAYTKWRPCSGCGTCEDSMECSRLYHMAVCNAHLKEYAAAVEVCYKATRKGGMGRSLVGVFLYHLYRDAGQLDDLRALFEVDDRMVTDPITETLRELFRIKTLGEKKDVAELIKVCQNSNSVHTFTYENLYGEWHCRAAAEALAQCGVEAVEQIACTIDARKNSVSWLIYALGKHPSEKALDALESLVKKEQSWNSGNVAYAISLHGVAGNLLLQVVAKQRNTGVQYAANEILNNRFKVVAPPAYPKPKPGALPKALFK